MKESTKFFIAVLVMTLIVVLWFTCVFDNLLDYLLAIWAVFFLAMLGICISAVVAVLLYDYMIHK